MSWGRVLRTFYSRPLGWGVAIFVSATLSYVGGGLMFWLHAVYRGEKGPAIGYVQHWVLDSTLGFIALTPIVLLLLPAVLWTLSWRGRRTGGVPVGLYVLAVGTLFALVTGPGPLLHNAIAGAGKPLANLATDVFGHDHDMALRHADAPERSAFTEGVLQVAVGIPAYSLLTLGSVVVVRNVMRSRRRDGDPRRGPGPGQAGRNGLTFLGRIARRLVPHPSAAPITTTSAERRSGRPSRNRLARTRARRQVPRDAPLTIAVPHPFGGSDMPRLSHGQQITTDAVQEAAAELTELTARSPLAFALAQPTDLQKFDFLFPALQADPGALLPEDPTTVANLAILGRTMRDPGSGPDPGSSGIPAAYTYFGQFVDHDLTLEALSASLPALLDPNLAPMTVPAIRSTLNNVRTATLDLDNVYNSPAPRDPADRNRMALGTVTLLGSSTPPTARPPGKGDDNDVPREGPNADHNLDRAAMIGDPRDDENLVISQLQVAFLKAHNRLVDDGHSFDDARRILRQHYQHIVVHDFLMRVCDPAVVTDILQNGPKAFDPTPSNFFMPLEFSVAGYRFGHTMVRNAYNFNVNFNFRGGIPATLGLLFTFTALSGELGGTDTLPENWIIEWENFVDAGGRFDQARRMDTKLVEFLFDLRNVQGTSEVDDGARLAVRNLLRGYLLRMPTGQAVAGALGIKALTPQEIEAAAASPEQVQALQDGGFSDRTPLWYYVLAEAAASGGIHLGAVGSTLVADVMIGLVRRSADSILEVPNWGPTMPSSTPGKFELRDLLAFAGVLPGLVVAPPVAPPTHTVQPGDTLFDIAQSVLGDGNRWPEIFALNRDQIGNPNLIFPGQVLRLPDAAPGGPPPQVYTVVPGDTLSDIARRKLGDANRWPEIFALNRTIINNPNLIFPGQVLLLPAS